MPRRNLVTLEKCYFGGAAVLALLPNETRARQILHLICNRILVGQTTEMCENELKTFTHQKQTSPL